jgi:hypothetical protein
MFYNLIMYRKFTMFPNALENNVDACWLNFEAYVVGAFL